MLRFQQMLSKLDFIGKPIQLKFKGSENFKTNFGGMLSLLIGILILLLAISLLIELFQRTNPSINLSTGLNGPVKISFEDNNYPLIFYFSDMNGFPIPNQMTLINLVGFSFNYNATSETNSTIRSKINYINITRCDEKYVSENFGKYSDIFLDQVPSSLYKSNSFLCAQPPKENYFISNLWGSFPFQFIQFSLTQCNNKTMNNTCQSKETIAATLSNTVFTIFSLNFYMDHQNYETPAKPYIMTQNFPVSSNLYKRYYIGLKSINYITDSGMILPNIKNHTYFQFSSIDKDVNTNSVTTLIPNTYANFLYTMSTNVFDIYTRQYLSLPQILANIGGAFNALFVISLCLNFYSEKISKEIEIFEACCGDSLLKRACLKNENSKIKKDENPKNLQNNYLKTNTILISEADQTNNKIVSEVDNQMNLKKVSKNNFHLENKSIIFDSTGLEEFLGIKFTLFSKFFPCLRNQKQKRKRDFAEKFSEQVFDIGFLFGSVLETQLLNLLRNQQLHIKI